jgi:hypothetical protein
MIVRCNPLLRGIAPAFLIKPPDPSGAECIPQYVGSPSWRALDVSAFSNAADVALGYQRAADAT